MKHKNKQKKVINYVQKISSTYAVYICYKTCLNNIDLFLINRTQWSSNMYDGTKEHQFLNHWLRRHLSYCMGHKNINRESKIVVSEIFNFLLILIYKVKAVCSRINKLLMIMAFTQVDVW